MNTQSEDLRKLALLSQNSESKISVGVGSVIVKDNKVLLVRSRDASSMWKFPGGHLQNTESIIDAAKRETLEETGFEIQVFGKPFSYEFDLSNELRLLLIFYCANIIGNGIPEDDGEITEVKWFDLEEIPENSFENVRPLMSYVKTNNLHLDSQSF